MKDLKCIKLTQLDQVQLEERKMSCLVGGAGNCNCGCYYANSGGSSTIDNNETNYRGGLTSYPTTPSPDGSCQCGCYYGGSVSSQDALNGILGH